MDGRSFDRFAQLMGSLESRRDVLRVALAAGLLGVTPAATEANKSGKSQRKGKGRGSGKRKRDTSRRGRTANLRAQALPARCCSKGNCTPGPGKNLGKCCFDGDNLAGQNFKGANLGGANFSGAILTDANLVGANLGNACLAGANLSNARINSSTNLGGAIYCGTRMPDGSINNSGCDASSPCCPTCAEACPPDPSNNDPGFCCAGGYCSCGGTCDCGLDCFIVTTETRGGDEPIVKSEEVCEPPEGCAICPSSGDQCCTACVGENNEECASSGPIIGGSIRRR